MGKFLLFLLLLYCAAFEVGMERLLIGLKLSSGKTEWIHPEALLIQGKNSKIGHLNSFEG